MTRREMIKQIAWTLFMLGSAIWFWQRDDALWSMLFGVGLGLYLSDWIDLLVRWHVKRKVRNESQKGS